MSFIVCEIIQHKKCPFHQVNFTLRGSCAPRVHSSSKEYCAPKKARLGLTSYAVYNPVRVSLSEIIQPKVLPGHEM